MSPRAPKGWGSGGALKQALYLGMPCTLNRSHLHYGFYLQRKSARVTLPVYPIWIHRSAALSTLTDLHSWPAARSWHLPQIMVSVLNGLGESLKASELVCEKLPNLREIGVCILFPVNQECPESAVLAAFVSTLLDPRLSPWRPGLFWVKEISWLVECGMEDSILTFLSWWTQQEPHFSPRELEDSWFVWGGCRTMLAEPNMAFRPDPCCPSAGILGLPTLVSKEVSLHVPIMKISF